MRKGLKYLSLRHTLVSNRREDYRTLSTVVSNHTYLWIVTRERFPQYFLVLESERDTIDD